VPEGDIGELVFRALRLLSVIGTTRKPQLSVFRDGWFFSGDLVRKDKYDFYSFVGLKKQLIVYRGLKISPLEIEQALETHPTLIEAGVLGISDRG